MEELLYWSFEVNPGDAIVTVEVAPVPDVVIVLLFSNVYPISEEYYGENNIKYKHVYYLGIINDIGKEVGIDQLNKHQLSEISDIQWVTKEEGYSKIRDYNTTKYEIIDKVFDFIDNYKKVLFIHK